MKLLVCYVSILFVTYFSWGSGGVVCVYCVLYNGTLSAMQVA